MPSRSMSPHSSKGERREELPSPRQLGPLPSRILSWAGPRESGPAHCPAVCSYSRLALGTVPPVPHVPGAVFPVSRPLCLSLGCCHPCAPSCLQVSECRVAPAEVGLAAGGGGPGCTLEPSISSPFVGASASPSFSFLSVQKEPRI